MLLYGIPLSYNLTSKLSKFNGDRWSLMIDSSFVTRVSSLFPAPVDIAAVRCCEGPGRHQFESRDCGTSVVRIKLVTTCRTSTRSLWKLTGSGWMSYSAKDFIHSINTRNTVVLSLILGKWQRRSACQHRNQRLDARVQEAASLPLRFKILQGEKTFRVWYVLKTTPLFFLTRVFFLLSKWSRDENEDMYVILNGAFLCCSACPSPAATGILWILSQPSLLPAKRHSLNKTRYTTLDIFRRLHTFIFDGMRKRKWAYS